MNKAENREAETKKGGIRIGALSQQKKDLKRQEARNVRGGAGMPGGVLGDDPGLPPITTKPK